MVFDERQHVAPPPEFNPAAGSAPVWYKVVAEGGICSKDLVFEVVTHGGIAVNCYKLTILGGTSPQTLEVPGLGHVELEVIGNAYVAGATLFFKFERTCAAAPLQLTYDVSGHL